jgi:Mg-chelatase subunit ChlD
MTARQRWTGVLVALACVIAGVVAQRALAGATLAFTLLGQPLEWAAPSALAGLCALPFLLWVQAVTLADLGALQRGLALLLRALLVTLLVLALAQPSRVRDSTRVSAVALFDVSLSISDEDLEDSEALLAELREAHGTHAFSAFAFAAHPRRLALDGARGPLLARPTAPNESLATDLERALQMAYSALEPGTLQRVLIVSDGRATRGSLMAEAARAAQLGVPIFHRTLARGRPAEIALHSLAVPEAPEVGRSFEVRAHVFSSKPARARVRLYQGELLNGLDASREVELAAGDNEIAFSSLARVPGEVVYRATLEPLGPDRFADNNSATAVADVRGRPSILFIDSEPARARHAAAALATADYEVDLREPSAAPRSLAELARYDFVILSDVPRSALASTTLEAFERYVRDVGGGFLMAGGENAFGLGGYEGSRLEAMLPVRMQSERRRDEHSLALMLVIDSSGSMAGAKIELAKDAARATAELLGAGDSIGVIGFSGTPERRVRIQSATNRLRIATDIARLTAQGGTAIFPALDLALSDLMSVRARVKHVILLTDGQTQESGIPELTQAMRAEGITLTAVGLGTDVNRSLLEQLASVGGGRAYFTTEPENVPRIFMRETSTVAQSAIVEEPTLALALEPADFLKGIDIARMPLLRGYVATQARPRPAQVILASEQGEPLLARWRVGLGWSLAFTSDLKPRWSSDWLRWASLPRFLGQLVREHMRQEREGELALQARVEGDELVVALDALDHGDRFLNGLDSVVTLEGPLAAQASERTRVPVPLAQRAPGYYAGRVPLDRVGSFALRGVHSFEGEIVARSAAQVTRPYPAELAALGPDASLLAAASALSSGAPLQRATELFQPRGQKVDRYEPLWPRLVFAALVLWLVDLLVRRAPIRRKLKDEATL